MYFVYILISLKNKKHYIGHTENIEKRLKRHNKGANISTRNGIPWKIIYQETFQAKKEAYQREMQIKSYKGGKAFKRLIKKL